MGQFCNLPDNENINYMTISCKLECEPDIDLKTVFSDFNLDKYDILSVGFNGIERFNELEKYEKKHKTKRMFHRCIQFDIKIRDEPFIRIRAKLFQSGSILINGKKDECIESLYKVIDGLKEIGYQVVLRDIKCLNTISTFKFKNEIEIDDIINILNKENIFCEKKRHNLLMIKYDRIYIRIFNRVNHISISGAKTDSEISNTYNFLTCLGYKFNKDKLVDDGGSSDEIYEIVI